MSDILNAVAANDADKVRSLIAARIAGNVPIDPNEQYFWNSYSVFHYAVKNNNAALLRDLLESARFNMGLLAPVANGQKQTSLQMAVALGLWDCVDVFTEFASDANDAEGYLSSIMELIRLRQFDRAGRLLSKVTPRIIQQNALNLVNAAIASLDPALIAVVLHANNIDFTSADFEPAYHTLCQRDDHANVGRLLLKGARPPVALLETIAQDSNWGWINFFIDNLPANLKAQYQPCINRLVAIAIPQAAHGASPLDKLLFLLKNTANPELAAADLQIKYTLAVGLLRLIGVTPITGEKATIVVRAAIASRNAELIELVLSSNTIEFSHANHEEAFKIAREYNDRERFTTLLQKNAKPAAALIAKDAADNNWSWVHLFINNLPAALKPNYSQLFNTLLLSAISQADTAPNADALATSIANIRLLLNAGATRAEATNTSFNDPRWHHLGGSALEQANEHLYKPAALLAFRNQWDILELMADFPSAGHDEAEYGVAMVIASYHGQLALAQKLLANGANMSSTCGTHHTTAVYGAITY